VVAILRNAVFQRLFLLALIFTLVALLTPASTVLAFKVWAASWLPWAGAMDRMSLGAQSDKLVHFGLFLLLGALAARSWPHRAGRWSAWLGLFLLGCLTEWLQQFVPGRGASGFDLAADVAGASLGLWWVRKEALRPVGGPA
jgi:VanZ family protein